MRIGFGAKQSRFGPRMASGWERFQAWQTSRKQAVQKYLTANADAGAAFTAAMVNQIQGQSTLAAQAALKRISESASAKVDQAKATLDKLV